MDAGKELNELVAHHVLGWKKQGDDWRAGDGTCSEIPPFSENIAASWMIAEKICEDGFRLQLDGSRIWQARFYKSAAHTLETRAYAATASTPAVAICRAALAVRNVAT